MNEILSFLRAADYQGIRWATDFTSSDPLIAGIVYFASEVLIFSIPLILLYMWEKRERREEHHGPKKAVIMSMMSIVVALAMKSFVGLLFFRPRPFVTHPDLWSMTLRSVDAGSFPSAHTMISFAVAFSVLLSGYKRLGWILMAIALIVALGRVFSGVHYPSDVIAGALIGLFSAWYLHREASGLKRYLPNE